MYSEISLGLCSRHTPLNYLPGWDSASWGYHGDDGKKYFDDTGTPYGTTFKRGDIIGCYVRLKENISFTLNGASLGKYTELQTPG
jgi:Ran-binding protein 9/10